jgi:hypothetical protein
MEIILKKNIKVFKKITRNFGFYLSIQVKSVNNLKLIFQLKICKKYLVLLLYCYSLNGHLELVVTRCK